MEQAREFERLYFNSDEFFSDLLESITHARNSIDIETYIYENDEFGAEVDRILQAAVQRGVHVRILVDGFGARAWVGQKAPDLFKNGVQIRVWRPVIFSKFNWKFLNRLNRRKHRKYCVIDKNMAYVGSQNISKVHLQRFSGEKAWRDSGIAIQGAGVDDLNRTFDEVWYLSHRLNEMTGKVRLRTPRAFAQNLINLTTQFSLRRPKHESIIRIQGAENRILITNAYFAPPQRLLGALLKARSRGVAICLLLPSAPDLLVMKWIATSYYDILLKNGIQLFEYKQSFLHAKTMIVDDWGIVGSSNFNTRSFRRDMELDIVLSSSDLRQELTMQFAEDLKYAREIRLEDLAFLTISRWLGRIFAHVLRWGL